MTTLLALYRRPDGGADALAEFERRYAAEHLPLVADTPGLRSTRGQRVSQALGGETDLVLVTAMAFDDRAALDAGLASDAMRAAGRNPARDRPGPRHPARPRGRGRPQGLRAGWRFPAGGYCPGAARNPKA
ncbi:MAG: EthD family reductase [Candidatus Limnocylindrales bacterium]